MLMNAEFRCRICGLNAHGNHFGVYSCRACAAFFRRTANSKLENEECKRGRSRDGCLCKPCRLRKCLKAGMNTGNFQFNRESNLPLLDSPDSAAITPSVSYFIGRPQFLHFCDPNLASTSPKAFIDVQNLITESSRLLDLEYHYLFREETQLKKLNLGFKFLKFDSENAKTLEKIGKKEFLDLVEYNVLTVTKWIMHFDEFRKQEKHIKITLIQTIWHIWSKIHKCVTTAMYRKSQSKSDPTRKVLRNMLVDKRKHRIDTTWMSDYPSDQVTKYMLYQNLYDLDVISAISKLDPTDIELTYMFAQLCFAYAGKRYPGEIQKIMDHFLQILSDDLHDYYVNDVKKDRYFYRLNELMKVNNLIQRSVWESRPHREIGRVFNVLRVQFSIPEMFEDSGFC